MNKGFPRVLQFFHKPKHTQNAKIRTSLKVDMFAWLINGIKNVTLTEARYL